jgi:hypothetical protein
MIQMGDTCECELAVFVQGVQQVQQRHGIRSARERNQHTRRWRSEMFPSECPPNRVDESHA